MALRIVGIMLVVTLVGTMACSEGGEDSAGLPTVADHAGGGFNDPAIECAAYCGSGDSMTFDRGLSPRDLCDHAICFVDGKCLYGCPDSLTPLCN